MSSMCVDYVICLRRWLDDRAIEVYVLTSAQNICLRNRDQRAD
jgi:hypothetical protein